MEPIVRGSGTTKTEKYLARLADHTFLDLWSYPNTFFDKRTGVGTDGKELADLLVVCGDDVIVFSDKAISWPSGDDVRLNWSRWYRRAIKKSVAQIRGAERWLRDYPSRIYLDSSCTKRFPIELPSLERMRFHGVAVALGAQKACREFFDDSNGSPLISTLLKGDDHCDLESIRFTPFAFGDVDPSGSFIHVFDEAALDLVISELDTVADFVYYLTQRALAIRSQHFTVSMSEADLLASYLQTGSGKGDFYFAPTLDVIGPGTFNAYVVGPKYRARKKRFKISYVWDQLIRQFTMNVIEGTSIEIADEKPLAARIEQGLRIMAQENRFRRCILGDSFVGAVREAERLKRDRFARVALPDRHWAHSRTGYVFLALANTTAGHSEDAYTEYRKMRIAFLMAYVQVVLYDNRWLERVVGIAWDAYKGLSAGKGGSEDLVAMEVHEWTTDVERTIEESRGMLDVLNPNRTRSRWLSIGEHMNRRQRRATLSKSCERS